MTVHFSNTSTGVSGNADRALLDLLGLLRDAGYRFTTPTPATHARVLSRPDRREARNLRDIFGWSLPFAPDLPPQPVLECLRAAKAVEEEGTLLRSRLRVSALRDDLYLHSAYPTEQEDSVFFGPDSYRFADLIASELAARPLSGSARIADIGGGAGVGAIVAAKLCPQARVVMTDVNPRALRLARINAAAAGASIETVEGSGLDGVTPPLDLATLNPPYIIDEEGRTYRDGGGMHGGALSLDLTIEAMERLAEGGRILLYTGSAIVEGADALRDALARETGQRDLQLDYREIDPDVFGEELAKPQYKDVERIALIAATISRP
jgi:methylase of polypeptide subunit release factors